MQFKTSDILFILLMLIAYFSHRAYQAPTVDENHPILHFESTKNHLNAIAQSPHPIGSMEHERVKNYIIDHAKDQGFQVHTTIDTLVSDRNCFRDVARIENIIVHKKGTQSKGAILLAAHYDSQPNTPGAADDSAPVSNMLALMEYYGKQSFQNDLIFLITDGEETGLYGARAFVENNPLATQVKYVFNFEARGNAGPVLGFEPNENNNSTMSTFLGMKHSFANSLMYEVYKLIPNDTDFTEFKKLDIGGISMAMVDGFVNYHSMTDTPQIISPNSLYHHGIMMTQLIEGYINDPLEAKHEYDITYFNTWGSLHIQYRSGWNLLFILLSLILFILWIRSWPYNFNTKDWAIGFLKFLAIWIIPLASILILNEVVKLIYPHYGNFYSHNFYNSTTYLIPYLTGILLLTKILGESLHKKKEENIFYVLSHGLVLWFVLSFLSHLFMPSAAHFFIIPLALFLLINLIFYWVGAQKRTMGIWAAAIVPFILWIPNVYLFFVVFSLEKTFIPLAVFSLLVMLIYPLLKDISTYWNWILMAIIAMLLIRAHVGSEPSEKRPLQANIYYQQKINEQEHTLRAYGTYLDEFEQSVMPKAEKVEGNYIEYVQKTELAIPFEGKWSIDTISSNNEINYHLRLIDSSEILKTIVYGDALSKLNRLEINGKILEGEMCQVNSVWNYLAGPLSIKFSINQSDMNQIGAIKVKTFRRGLIPMLTDNPSIIPGIGFYGGGIVHIHEFQL